jgi:hypothetical protein
MEIGNPTETLECVHRNGKASGITRKSYNEEL